ncbi:DNA cross-link repair 1A protein [Parambassis ranga]|uniref:DNA cross-link repair 1A protein n=1 Tax=Parambassis ranga TaxID=210632 RepID=A0A6P7KES0_9TELE|nr:DNA cross-link repair 1A protein [Parambassis ranga]
MSQKDDSENDIWEYKPLQKKNKRSKSPSPTVSKRSRTSRRTSKKNTFLKHIKNAENKAPKRGDGSTVCMTEEYGYLEAHDLTLNVSPCAEETIKSDNGAEGPPPGDFCPICHMPFCILLVQSQRWHVAECLDTSREKCEECPDGLQCSSTIPSHYKKFNHTLLAHSRANSDAAPLSLSQQAETSKRTNFNCLPGLINNEVDDSILETSQDSALSLSALSSNSVSPNSTHTGTPQSKLTNGLLFLRSPGPEDCKKKKGWLSSSKSQKSIVASQESKNELLSTPVKENSAEQACKSLKCESSAQIDDAISYSPLSEFPAEAEVNDNNESRKALFKKDTFENVHEDSMTLFNDSFSSDDELLTEFIDNRLEASNMPVKDPFSSSTQLGSFSSLALTNQLAASDASGEEKACAKSNEVGKTSFQSPQSIVLESLRTTILSSEDLNWINSIQTEQPQTTSLQVPSSQSSIVPGSQTMPPQKGFTKAGQASGLKQTDIGVFFGLKPLKEKEVESGPKDLNLSSFPSAGETSGWKRQRRERQRKCKITTNTEATETVQNSTLADGQEEAGKGRRRRRRWNRVNADGEVELPRCPFYKKIPGTKFVIDAFRYGEIEGITAYFLTHFHSDHYGGLTKSSTFPIYCNRITGNLVKSKLKVAEQYVHILPMNKEVTVEGVRVILLDANHCPGAAMLLFFLPDGQTVLHTGDFRADPSMETYPELLSCRVQTVYLDTTYCSPEYTFPRQQEVINFAANTAFELVTLNPRTLVVCGSYSVGKEKVFLALAEVLGSKVCLSRDKYNTMCCLESEEVRERITTDWKAAQVHVLPMMQLTFKKLQDHLARFSSQYDQLVAFKPTGWTFSQQVESMEDIQPQISGNISIYGVPYSEHSSFLELKRFVQWLQPLKIIPTVNNGSWTSRKAMDNCFSEWLNDTKAKL